MYICRQNCPSHLKFHADETSIAFSLAPDLHGRRRPAGDLPQPGHCGRHGRPDGHPGRQHLLCDGHLIGMGPLLPVVPLQRPGQLAADRAPVRAAARMDEILVLGPGTFPPQRQNIRLLYGTPENRRDVVYRRRHGRQTRRPLYRPRPDRRVRHRGDRRIRAGRCRRTVYLVESLRARPKADRTPGLQNLGRRAAHGGGTLHAAARRQTAGHGRAALAENRRLLLHRLLHKRLLRPWERLRRGGRPLEKPAGPLRALRREPDPARRRRCPVHRARHRHDDARREDVLPLPRLSGR